MASQEKKFIEKESRMGANGGQLEKNGELVLNGDRGPAGEDEKVPETDDGDGRRTT